MKFREFLNEDVKFSIKILDREYRNNYSKASKIIDGITNFLNRKIKTSADLNNIEEIIKSNKKFDFESFEKDTLKLDYKLVKPSETVYVPVEIYFNM